MLNKGVRTCPGEQLTNSPRMRLELLMPVCVTGSHRAQLVAWWAECLRLSIRRRAEMPFILGQVEVKLQQLKCLRMFVQGAPCGWGVNWRDTSSGDKWQQVPSTSPEQPSRWPLRLEKKDFFFKLTFKFPTYLPQTVGALKEALCALHKG